MNKTLVSMGLTLGLLAALGSTVMAATPANQNLVLRYTFDDIQGNRIIDSTGHKLDGILEGKAVQSPGMVDKALVMDGDENYIKLPDKALDNLQEFTMASWYRVDERRPWSRLWDFGTGTENYIFLSPVSGNQTTMAEAKNTGTNSIAQRSPQTETGVWHHTAITMKGKEIKLFLDGKMVAYNSFPEDTNLDYQAWMVMEQNYIGKSQFGADALFKGAVDEFRIYGKALTDEEVATITAK